MQNSQCSERALAERRYLKKYSFSGLTMETHKSARARVCVYRGWGPALVEVPFGVTGTYSLQLLNFVD